MQLLRGCHPQYTKAEEQANTFLSCAVYDACPEKCIDFFNVGICRCKDQMEAIIYLGFAIQAADVSTRTAIGLKDRYQRARGG